jgi:aminoglycoside 3-N-acetyltransferase
MESKQLVDQTETPSTTISLTYDLRVLGVRTGMTVLVHSSLKSLGWVCGGTQAVIQALMDVVTKEGTLVLPAHSGGLSDPANWQMPPVPEEWWEMIRETMPAFERDKTPTRSIGIIPEQFRTYPDVLRSYHPNMSFAAWGKNADLVTSDHSLDDGLGERSPLARLYNLDAEVLFLGADFDTHTSFHLSEHRAGVRKTMSKGAPIIEDGKRIWKNYLEINYDDEQFGEIGKAFETEHPLQTGKVGSATCKLFKMRPSVDFAVGWMKENRKEA